MFYRPVFLEQLVPQSRYAAFQSLTSSQLYLTIIYVHF